jgi:hypothetical protein
MQRFALIGAAAVAAVALHAAPALAQAVRTFVSGHGSDSGTCTLGAPCRSFAYAITQTSASGEITVLDPAGYGAVTINQAISIDNDGVGEAGITVTTSEDAITINTAGPSDVVNLRGLTLVGSGAAHNGITLTNAGTVNIQNCVIHGFSQAMILAPTGSNRVNVSDTIVSDNSNGISYFPSGSSATNTIFFERVQALGNSTSGFSVGGNNATGGTVRGMAADSAASTNGSSGFAVSSLTGGATATFTIVASRVIGNTTGVSSDATSFNATLVLTGTTISGNLFGYLISGNSRIDTYQDNHIVDTTNTGTLTMLSDQ